MFDIGFTIHHYDASVLMTKYRDSSNVLSCNVDGILLCCGEDDDIPELLVSDLKRHFSEVKLDKSNKLDCRSTKPAMVVLIQATIRKDIFAMLVRGN